MRNISEWKRASPDRGVGIRGEVENKPAEVSGPGHEKYVWKSGIESSDSW